MVVMGDTSQMAAHKVKIIYSKNYDDDLVQGTVLNSETKDLYTNPWWDTLSHNETHYLSKRHWQ